MPFWVRDWLADEAIARMTLAQQGAYIALLAHCWREGFLAVNPPQGVGGLRRLIPGGGSRGFTSTIWPALAPHFVDVAPGKICNKRLLFEGLRQVRERRRKAAERSDNGRTTAGQNRHLLPSSSFLPPSSDASPHPPKPSPRQNGTSPRQRGTSPRQIGAAGGKPPAPPGAAAEKNGKTLPPSGPLSRRTSFAELDDELFANDPLLNGDACLEPEDRT
ncbi:MAG TPA: hypothetical protein VFG76_00080 [Candidatus Polarisedimenticolia bacterium]|nr:hypothetical protein [Candidatus Polarisedimenticolia bacterium]